MKKPQALKFWKALHESTNSTPIVEQFKNKKGYDSRRTLKRWAQADSLFQCGASSEDVAAKTEWSIISVLKIRAWWESAYKCPSSVEDSTTRSAESQNDADDGKGHPSPTGADMPVMEHGTASKDLNQQLV